MHDCTWIPISPNKEFPCCAPIIHLNRIQYYSAFLTVSNAAPCIIIPPALHLHGAWLTQHIHVHCPHWSSSPSFEGEGNSFLGLTFSSWNQRHWCIFASLWITWERPSTVYPGPWNFLMKYFRQTEKDYRKYLYIHFSDK